MNFLEGWTLLCIPPPAAQHNLVERVWAQHRLGQVDLQDKVRETEVWDSGVLTDSQNAYIHAHLSFLVPEKLPRVFYHLLISELRVGLLLAEV